MRAVKQALLARGNGEIPYRTFKDALRRAILNLKGAARHCPEGDISASESAMGALRELLQQFESPSLDALADGLAPFLPGDSGKAEWVRLLAERRAAVRAPVSSDA